MNSDNYSEAAMADANRKTGDDVSEYGEGNLLAPAYEIPDKLFFRIGEVSRIVGVEPYVLRYWESEFRGLSPKKSSSGQRMFRKKDVELLLRIRHLLYERKFTIDGARKVITERGEPGQQELFANGSDPLPEIRKQVVEILRLMV